MALSPDEQVDLDTWWARAARGPVWSNLSYSFDADREVQDDEEYERG